MTLPTRLRLMGRLLTRSTVVPFARLVPCTWAERSSASGDQSTPSRITSSGRGQLGIHGVSVLKESRVMLFSFVFVWVTAQLSLQLSSERFLRLTAERTAASARAGARCARESGRRSRCRRQSCSRYEPLQYSKAVTVLVCCLGSVLGHRRDNTG